MITGIKDHIELTEKLQEKIKELEYQVRELREKVDKINKQAKANGFAEI